MDNMNKSLLKWMETRNIECDWVDYPTLNIFGFGKAMVISPKEGKIFNEDFVLNVSDEEFEAINEDQVKYLVYQFGEMWYYSSVDDNDQGYPRLLPFEYVGNCTTPNPEGVPMLGVHGSMDLLTGSRPYADWVTKAKFMGVSVLGICENNTLGGVIDFQNSCISKGIRPVIGESIRVAFKGEIYWIKLYVVNNIGWHNLLKIDKIVNVDLASENAVDFEKIFCFGSGLVLVVAPQLAVAMRGVSTTFDKTYANIDAIEYDDPKLERSHLLAIQECISNKFEIDPIVIQDAYYLEEDHFYVTKTLGNINSKKVAGVDSSYDYFFRTNEYSKNQFLDMCEDKVAGAELWSIAVSNSIKLAGFCQFNIDLSEIHMPRYEMTEEEAAEYPTVKSLFMAQIAKGFAEKIRGTVPDTDIPKYKERLLMELKVINRGDFIDYFMILWSKINFCDQNNILYALGRGSAAGCLVSYLLGVVGVDPVRWGLLFSRFLNEARLPIYEMKDFIVIEKNGWKYKFEQGDYINVDGSMIRVEDFVHEVCSDEDHSQKEFFHKDYTISFERLKYYTRKTLPDIDTDYDSERRADVIKFLQDRLGYDRVCAIGTLQQLHLKSAVKDVLKADKVDFKDANTFTRILDEDTRTADNLRESYGKGFTDFEKMFWVAHDSEKGHDFMRKHSMALSQVQLILGQTRSLGTHACGFVTVPKHDQLGNEITVHDIIPVRRDKDTLVSMWVGEEIEEMGLVKLDVLATRQLTKFAQIFAMIEKETGERLRLDKIPLDDADVYQMFCNGFNKDVFQFNGDGMTKLSRQLEPDGIEDLVAMNALFRPAILKLGLHNKYVNRKFKDEEVIYPWGCKEVLSQTYGIIIYQEQSMKIVQVVAGFSEVEADDFRKVTAKKKLDEIGKFQEKFMDGAISNGCPDDEAEALWEMLLQFASYSFNRSHALCYAIIGYVCQWLKHHYPVYFWKTALNEADSDKINDIVEEMESIGHIVIAPPSINNSFTDFIVKNNTIYWSLEKIKFVGTTATDHIIEERKNGMFFDIKDLITRTEKRKVNSRTVKNMIISGCFDEEYDIKKPSQRFKLIEEYYEITGDKWTDRSMYENKKDYFWSIKQKDLSGIGFISFKSIIAGDEDLIHLTSNYLEYDECKYEDNEGAIANIAGRPEEINVRNSKNGKWVQLKMRNNLSSMYVNIWSDQYKQFQSEIDELTKESVIIIEGGKLKYDNYKQENVLHSSRSTKIHTIT